MQMVESLRENITVQLKVGYAGESTAPNEKLFDGEK